MKVVILAAGRGTRLGKLTEKFPKCMLNFGNESILQRQVRILKECGINENEIYVVVGYQWEQVRAHLPIVNYVINDRYYETDNSYSLHLALKEIDDDVIILDGDLIFESGLMEGFVAQNGNVALALPRITGYEDTGITLHEDGSIAEIGKHILSDTAYGSMLRLEKNSIGEMQRLLSRTEHEKTWYTISLNEFVKDNTVKVFLSSMGVHGINSFFEYISAKRLFGVEDFSILVTGASGFLGEKIYHTLKRDYKVEGIKGSRSDKPYTMVDLTNKKETAAYVELKKPKVIVHTAGIADPEQCMSNKENAYAVNVTAVRNLTEICAEHNIKLIHISTDYVFDGNKTEPYSHLDERRPCNYYGETKKEAEDIVREYENSLIVRIPIIYGYNDEYDKETFPVHVVRQLMRHHELYLDNQQIRYPVLIDTIAIAVSKAISKTGIIHITSSQPVTKYEWAQIIAEEFSLDKALIHEKQHNELADRPKHVKLDVTEKDYSVMDVSDGTRVLRKQRNCVFKLIYKGVAADEIYGKNIAAYRIGLGRNLASAISQPILQDIDYIVPVPNSGLYYAMGLSEKTGIPYMQGLIKPDGMTRSFQIADLTLREQTIREKIIPIKPLLQEKNIALVDEAIFTGTTLRCVCDMLRACNVNKIFIFIPTPICSHQCHQFVQPERQLLSQNISSEKMREYFGAEAVIFQSQEVFLSSIQDIENICFECFVDKANQVVVER